MTPVDAPQFVNCWDGIGLEEAVEVEEFWKRVTGKQCNEGLELRVNPQRYGESREAWVFVEIRGGQFGDQWRQAILVWENSD